MQETLTFPAGSVTGDTLWLDIPLINNPSFEKTEYFYVHVGDVEENVVVHQQYVPVHIYDDDCK